jgi:hypothetical protein
MPGLTGELVVTTLVCFLHCTRGCGCIGARHSPRPLFSWGGDFLHTSGASRRENAKVCVIVIASEAKQSNFLLVAGMDCFASLAMTAARVLHGLTRHRPRKAGDPVFQRRLRMNREAAAYWIVRSSRTMTAVKIESANTNSRRPGLEPGSRAADADVRPRCPRSLSQLPPAVTGPRARGRRQWRGSDARILRKT